MNLPAITIYQPHASLCVLAGSDGKAIKQYETRSWKRDSLLGQRIAIHAGAKVFQWGYTSKPIRDALESLGWPRFNMPIGAILGSAVVHANWYCAKNSEGHPILSHFINEPSLYGTPIPETQLPFGDYSEGRWAWELTDVERLVCPIPANGKQGIWRLTDEQQAAYDGSEKVRVR